MVRRSDMTITFKQVNELQSGDTVRVTGWNGLTVEGPVVKDGDGSLRLGDVVSLRYRDDRLPPCWITRARHATLTVLERAARPLYRNHTRTEPVVGDIAVQDHPDLGRLGPYLYTGIRQWAGSETTGGSTGWVGLPDSTPDRGPIYASRRGDLVLLVDGETLRAVPE
jgi:hypothetical protein